MPQQQIERRKPDYYGVLGDLTFDTIVHVEQEGFAAIDDASGSVMFDFSQVGQCSSATLALLLSWVRYSNGLNKHLSVTGASHRLLGQLRSVNLEHLVSIES